MNRFKNQLQEIDWYEVLIVITKILLIIVLLIILWKG